MQLGEAEVNTVQLGREQKDARRPRANGRQAERQKEQLGRGLGVSK
jgi:hypothetical protein